MTKGKYHNRSCAVCITIGNQKIVYLGKNEGALFQQHNEKANNAQRCYTRFIDA